MSARRHRRAVAAMVVALATAAASAETIYRCGDSYSQSPCSNARTIEVLAPPTEAQRAEARALAAREKQLEMARDRRERESAIRPATAASLSPRAPMAAASAPARKHAHASRDAPNGDSGVDFVAAVPNARK